MKTNLRNIACLLLTTGVLSVHTVYSQNSGNEFLISGAGSIPLNSRSISPYYAFGVGYTRFFNPHWGLSSGLELALCQRKFAIDGFKAEYATDDVFGNPVIYHSILNGYRERQRLGQVNIPLSVIYQTGSYHKFYVELGFKFGLPVFGQTQTGDAILTAYGYYPAYDQTEIWQNDLGYGVFPVAKKTEPLDLHFNGRGTLETGLKWDLGNTRIYTGIFVDYAFGSMLKNGDTNRQFIEYNRSNPAMPLVNGFLQQERFPPLTLGLKIKFAFPFGYSGNETREPFFDDDFYEFSATPSRIQTFSKDEAEPLFPNDREENRKKNRRLEIKVIK